jgi:hypothetical protein
MDKILKFIGFKTRFGTWDSENIVFTVSWFVTVSLATFVYFSAK